MANIDNASPAVDLSGSRNPTFAGSSIPFGLGKAIASVSDTTSKYSSPVLVDIDGDGDFDAFVGVKSGNVYYFENTGNASAPSFAAPTIQFGIPTLGTYSTPTFGDIDSDGDLDLFSGSAGGTIYTLENTGSATSAAFAAPSNKYGIGYSGSFADPTFADIDGDNDLDIIGGQSGGQIWKMENTGSASSAAFSSRTNYNLNSSSYASPELVDIDSEGDLDLLIGSSNGNTRLSTNNGNSNIASFASLANNSFGIPEVGVYNKTSLVDIDADGDLDAFIGNSTGNIYYFQNTGTGGVSTTKAAGTYGAGTSIVITVPFNEVVTVTGTPTLLLETGSIDRTAIYSSGSGTKTLTFLYTVQEGDSSEDLDFTSTSALSLNGGTIQDGAGNDADLTLPTPSGAGSLGARAALMIDAPDVSAPNAPSVHGLSMSTDSGSSSTDNITTITAPIFTGSAEANSTVVLYDTDGTTVIGTTTTDSSGAWWVESSTLSVGTHLVRATATDTLNHTSDVSDALSITIDGIAPTVDRSIFAEATISFGLPNVGGNASPELADIDLDGDLDLFVGNYAGNTLFYLNSGSASNPAFVGSSLGFGIPNTGLFASPTMVDIDADGDLDLFIGEGQGSTLFFENEGTASSASFAGSSIGFGLADVGTLASPTFADIDADGDVDAFIGNADGFFLFIENIGNATGASFAEASMGRFGLPSRIFNSQINTPNPTFNDIDGDGDLDLFVGHNYGSITLFENTGNASSAAFAESASFFGLTQAGYAAKPTFADIDSDGDLDAFIGNSLGNTLFIENRGNRSVTSTNSNGSYGIGDTIAIEVPFTEVVYVAGTPTLVLETGNTDRTAVYSSGSGSNVLTFTYTVQEGDNSTDLDIASSAALELSEGTIQDAAGNDASLSLPEPGTPGSLAANGALVIAGFAPPDAPIGLYLDEYSETGYSYTDNITSITTPTIRGTAEADSAVDLYDSDGTTSLGSTTADENGNWSIATSTLSAGIHRLTAKATNANNITSSASAALSITIDNFAASVDLSGSRNPAFVAGSIIISLPNGIKASPVLADMNNDGDLDLIAGDNDGNLYLVENTGSSNSPSFAEPVTAFGLPDLGFKVVPAFADLDGDGDLDLFVGERYGSILYFENTGNAQNASFAESALAFGIADIGEISNPTFADINGDGDLDLFIGDFYGNTFYLENNGTSTTPAFAEPSLAFGLPGVGKGASPTFADINGDGDLDLFIGERYGNTFFFENTGTATNPSFAESSIAFGINRVNDYAKPVFIDFDGDGDLDLVIGNYGGTIEFFENTGSGGITTTNSNGNYREGDTITIEVPFSEIVTVDDQGGVPFLFLQISGRNRTANYSTGSGTKILTFTYVVEADDSSPHLDFSSSSALLVPEGSSIRDAAGIDADRTLPSPGAPGSLSANAELIIDQVGPQVNISLFSDESNRYGLPDVGANASPSFADLDSDGDLDLYIGNTTGQMVYFENTGNATEPGFAESTNALNIGTVGNHIRTSFADMDADGDLDILFGNYEGETYYLENISIPGSIGFTDASNRFELDDIGNLAKPTFADIDSDGDYDLFVGAGDGNTFFYRNTGNASNAAFAASSIGFDIADIGGSARPTFADIDGDGDLDLLIGNYDGNTIFFENTGTATNAGFAEATPGFILTNTGVVASPALADIDGDGDLDLFIGGYYGDTVFLENTGSGGVTSTYADDTYRPGDTITIEVPFTEVVTVTGTPTLLLETGSTDQVATYSSGSGTNTLTFTYTVQARDNSADLDYSSSSALELNEGSIKDAAGNDASLTLPGPGTAGSLGANGAIVIDTPAVESDSVAPQITVFSISGPSLTYGLADVGKYASPTFADIDNDGDLDLFIGNTEGNTYQFENIGSSTNPEISDLAIGIGPDVGGYASPIFADIDSDGDLDLFIGDNNGSIFLLENTGSATNPAFGETSIAFLLPNEGTYASPTFADIDADGDLDLFVGERNGNIYKFENTGNATIAAFANTASVFLSPSELLFSSPTLVDVDGDSDLDLFIGAVNGNTYLYENTGTSTNPAFSPSTIGFVLPDIGDYAKPTFADINGDGTLDLFVGEREGNTIVFESLTKAGVTSTTTSGTYGIGDTITIEVSFSEVVLVDTTDSSPTLQLETGSTDRTATYSSGSGTNSLTFTYTVQAGDSTTDLDYTSTSALSLNGATIKDAAGNDASLTLAAPGGTGSLGANASLVINTSTSQPVEPGDDGSDPTYETSQGDFNGDGIDDDTQANVATFSTSDGPTSLAIKDPVVNQVVDPITGGSVAATTQLHLDAAVSDFNAVRGLQQSIDLSDPTVQVSAVSDLISFTVTPTVTTAGDVSNLDVSGITTSALEVFESTIQEVEIYFQESTINNGWNALYKKKANGDYYLFNYDPLTGLGAMLLDRDNNGSIDGAKLFLKDGALGDFDETVNGQIADPVGFTTLSVDPTLRVSDNGKGLTVDGIAGTGLWISLDVSSFTSSTQGNLELYNASSGDSYGAIGATLGAGPTGEQALYLAAGNTLSFRYSNGPGQTNNNPALSINNTATGFTLGLDVDLNGIYSDMILDIRSAIAASSTASLAIARKQLSSSDTILDLTSIAATGISLTLDISTDCSLRNQFGFVKLELDPLTGTTYQVNGVSQTDTAAFRSAMLSQWSNPYQGTGTSHQYGRSRQTITWNLDSTEAGYYAPVMITQGGEVLTFGSSTASDGRQHVKLLGTNTFGFEDLLASQGSDWDFNDTKIRVSVA